MERQDTLLESFWGKGYYRIYKEFYKSGVKMAQGNISRVVRYIIDNGGTSKAKVQQDLGLSMPTVLQIFKILKERGIVKEAGSYESTGGRKAKSIVICEDLKYAVGLDITGQHIGLVIVDMCGQVVKNLRKRIAFEATMEYCVKVAEDINSFIKESGIEEEKILGVGVALAGIVDYDSRMLIKSHTLKVENFNLKIIENIIGRPVYFENDANAALMAEKTIGVNDTLYISLSNTVGGAIYLNGDIYRGATMKAGEVGHLVLHPGGRKCYCGKMGCADAYLSALNLRTGSKMSLEDFMKRLSEGDKKCVKIWDEYLDELALLIVNLRTVFDSDIIIGGYVGYYIEDYILKLGEKVISMSTFDNDISYIHASVHKMEASAVGAASYFIDRFVEEI